MEQIKSGRERQQDAKRVEILSAAADIFFQEGYSRVGMDRIISEIGGSKRTLYKYFRNKDQLFEAIIASVSDRVMAALEPPLEDGAMKEMLIAMGERYLRVLLSPDGLALYRAIASEAAHFPDLAKTFFVTGPGRASANLAVYLERQSKKGTTSIKNPEQAAGLFLGMVRGDLHLAAVFLGEVPSDSAIKQSVERAVTIFLAGLACKP